MVRFLRDVKDGNLAAVQRALASNPSVIRAKEPGVCRLHPRLHRFLWAAPRGAALALGQDRECC